MNKMMIECKDLVKKYRQENQEFQAVDHASFSVKKGEFIAILGHSGSGKTTLLSMIGGLTKPDHGYVVINGIDCWQQNEMKLAVMRNQIIGFIFQFGSLVPTLTSMENVLLPLSFADSRTNPSAKIPFARELLDQVGLGGKENSFPSQLSGGQQRRVAIARAFINSPSIILADEPTGDLDEETEKEILEIFRQYNTEKKTTFLVVTHNSKLVLTQNNPRTFLMKSGELAETSVKNLIC